MAGRGGILKNPTSATFPCQKGPPIRAADASQTMRAGLRRACHYHTVNTGWVLWHA